MKNFLRSSRTGLLRISAIISIVLSFPICHAKGFYSNELNMREATSRIDPDTYTLPLPEVPRSLSTPPERAAFVADHYWDEMNWNDSLLLNSEKFMGESLATYGMLLGIAPRERAASAVCSLINSLNNKPSALQALSEYAYSYFYHPESPQYDEELYLLFVDPLLNSSGIDEGNSERLKKRRADILQNRVGSIATDFTYVGTDGCEHALLSTSPETEYRLLLLYDPNCQVCEEAVKVLKSSEAFSKAQATGKVAVIAINAYGQEKPGPAMRKTDMPDNWIIGYSPEGEIDRDEIYIIRTAPAIYILDSAGRIIKKDLSIERLADFINSTF